MSRTDAEPAVGKNRLLFRSFWLPLNAVIQNWRTRRQLRTLTELEESTLKDIGITRGDVIWAMSLPLHLNASAELNKISKPQRRR
ncbi:DUF1127 domain-containing protein [Rhodoligotrophos appendicifer]|uniref:DUF1127 domain-containing protein n=1 Tax=Rhodoligotrophos appendicifer TaxID=987056 RepID=UPI001185D757